MNNIHLAHLYFLIFFGLFSGCQQSTSKTETNSSEDTQSSFVDASISLDDAQQKLAGIETGTVSLRNMSSIVECSGQIEVPPMFHHSVYAPIHGFVQSVRHLEGDYIKKGTILTTLTHPDLIHLQRSFLETISELDFLKSDFQRKETLVKEEAGSQKAFEEARSHYNTKQAMIKGLEAELNLIGISVKELRDSGKIITHLNLYAPTSGFITAVNINLGKLVEPDEELFEIIDNQHLHLELFVFAKDLPKIKAKQRVEARLPGSEQSISGKVHLVGKTINLDKKTARVHVHLDNGAPKLAVGTYLPAKIYIDDKEVPVAPETALVRDGESQYLFIKQADGFMKTAVKTGMNDDGLVELLNWNYPPETMIVTKGAYYIQDEE